MSKSLDVRKRQDKIGASHGPGRLTPLNADTREKQKILALRLRIGMTIYSLDRPCVFSSMFDGPGMMIRTQNELYKLQSCGAVYAEIAPFEEKEPEPKDDDYQARLETAAKLQREAESTVQESMALARAGKAINVDRVMKLVNEIIVSLAKKPVGLKHLAKVQEADRFAFAHCVNIAKMVLSMGIMRRFSDERLMDLGTAAVMHDIGHARIPEDVLTKLNLTQEDHDLLQRHPEYGADVLNLTPGIPEAVIEAVLDHHERLDGMGYPAKKKGPPLGEFARILAVADVYESMTHPRYYHEQKPHEETLSHLMIFAEAGHFDLRSVQQVIQLATYY
ncbi:MAG: HD domain-containing protein [Nitrospirae bacterium]|nr:MAG: HD domain-containing protein [Nitrospirota bacterium]